MKPSLSDITRPLWVVSIPGRSSYRPLWNLQQRLWRARHAGAVPDTLLLLEHEPVITLGRNAHREHLLLAESEYRARGVEVVEVDRGGDVTYHGPGQLVGYWIFDLRDWQLDLGRYLREIEGVLIDALANYGIAAGRSSGATGVWVGDAKIAAIGLHMSRWVSTHGFAFNLEADLDPFRWIVPCGLHGRPVTSLAKELAGAPHPASMPPRSAVECGIVEAAERRFGRTARIVQRAALERALDRVQQSQALAGETTTHGAREGSGNAGHRPANAERNGACLV